MAAQDKDPNEEKTMGRPRVFKDPIMFEIKWLDRALAAKIDKERGKRSRRAYVEYLLSTHPELQEDPSTAK